MRQDQFEKLQALEEKLIDVALTEANSDHWPGVGILPAQLDQQTRGDRYWCKKNAVATISLIQRIGCLVNGVRLTGTGTTAPEPPEGEPAGDSLDSEITSAEKEAARLMKRFQGAGKAAWDAKTHGKP